MAEGIDTSTMKKTKELQLETFATTGVQILTWPNSNRRIGSRGTRKGRKDLSDLFDRDSGREKGKKFAEKSLSNHRRQGR